MNIFLLSRNARKAAEYHCDKHVVKMILETAQLLYTAHHIVCPEGKLPGGAYKKTHAHHPCAVWVRESQANYAWLCELGWWLCKEYQFRYGNHKTHKTEAHLVWLQANPPPGLPEGPLTPFRLAMPVEYHREDPVEAYRTYYTEFKMKQRNIVKYTRRPPPDFLPPKEFT